MFVVSVIMYSIHVAGVSGGAFGITDTISSTSLY